MKFIIAAWILFVGAPCLARAERIKVRFSCSCEDQVGARYATALRDLLASSPRYTETPYASEPKGPDSKEKIYHWEIQVVSIDVDDPALGHQSALSVVFMVDDVLLSHHIQTCGASVVSQCAATTLASLDKLLN